MRRIILNFKVTELRRYFEMSADVSRLQPRHALVWRSRARSNFTQPHDKITTSHLNKLYAHFLPSLEVSLLPLTPTMASMPYQILRDDFKLSTLLYMGAFIQAVLFLIAPHRIVAMPVILTLAGLVTKNILIRFGFIRDPSFDRVYVGRTTAQIVNDDGSVPENGCDKEIVVFLLGSCTNK